jgi:hypothetical protein
MPISPTSAMQYVPRGTFSNPQQGGMGGLPGTQMLPQPGWFSGTPSQIQSTPRYTGDQQQLFQQLQQILGGTGGLMAQATQRQSFEPFAQEARQNFAQQTLPGLVERFTGLTGGKLSSPSFAAQAGAAGAQLDQGLAAEKGRFELGQQGMQQNLLGMLLGPLMKPQFEQQYIPGQSSRLGALLGGLAPAAGQLTGAGGLLGLLNYMGLLDQFKQQGAQ